MATCRGAQPGSDALKGHDRTFPGMIVSSAIAMNISSHCQYANDSMCGVTSHLEGLALGVFMGSPAK